MIYNPDVVSDWKTIGKPSWSPGQWGILGQENTVEISDLVCRYCEWCGRALNNHDVCDHCGAPAKRKENRMR